MKQVEDFVVQSRCLNPKLELLTIKYGFAATPFGKIIVGCLSEENDAVCYLHFVKNEAISLQSFQKKWRNATFVEDKAAAERIAKRIALQSNEPENIEVVVNGTPFQNLVWDTLLKINRGATKTYSEVAEMIGRPSSVRAVANAVAGNEISLLIPCHRVVSKDENKVKYGPGPEIKLKILSFEKC